MPLGSGTQAITLNKQWIAYICSVSVCMDMIERGKGRGRMDLTPTILSLGGNAEEAVVTDWFRSALSLLKEPGVNGCGFMFFMWQQPCCCAVGTLSQQSCITSKRQPEMAEPISTSTTASLTQLLPGEVFCWGDGAWMIPRLPRPCCAGTTLLYELSDKLKQLNSFTFSLFKWSFAVVWVHSTF